VCDHQQLKTLVSALLGGVAAQEDMHSATPLLRSLPNIRVASCMYLLDSNRLLEFDRASNLFLGPQASFSDTLHCPQDSPEDFGKWRIYVSSDTDGALRR